MFEYWTTGLDGKRRTIRDVAKRFGRSETCIYRIKLRQHWEHRYEALAKESRRKSNNRIAARALRTREILEGTMQKMGDAVLNEKAIIKIDTTDDAVKVIAQLVALGWRLLQLEGTVPHDSEINLNAKIKGMLVGTEKLTDIEVADQLMQHALFAKRGEKEKEEQNDKP